MHICTLQLLPATLTLLSQMHAIERHTAVTCTLVFLQFGVFVSGPFEVMHSELKQQSLPFLSVHCKTRECGCAE